jgi:hypothetical protein
MVHVIVTAPYHYLYNNLVHPLPSHTNVFIINNLAIQKLSKDLTIDPSLLQMVTFEPKTPHKCTRTNK